MSLRAGVKGEQESEQKERGRSADHAKSRLNQIPTSRTSHHFLASVLNSIRNHPA
jgi:hypothetical protein